jgi:hypothetical protein
MNPQTLSTEEYLATARQAERWLQVGALSLLLIPLWKLIELGWWYSQRTQALHESTSGFLIAGIGIGIIMTAAIVFPYRFLFPLVAIVAAMAHVLFGGKSKREVWLSETYRALWSFPYVAWVGVIVGILHYDGPMQHFLYPIIIGQLLGAACYMPIFLAWYRVRKYSTT